MRALDLALPRVPADGQDFVAAWTIEGGGQFRPGFPTHGQRPPVPHRAVGRRHRRAARARRSSPGTASKDLAGVQRRRACRSTPRWPKLTTDWTVANPLIGIFGTLDTDAAARRKVVVGMTRSGYLNAYATDAPGLLARPRGRASTTTTPTRATTSRDAVLPGQARSSRRVDAAPTLDLQRARRRPALRHRRPLRDRHLDRARSTSRTSTRRRRSRGAPDPGDAGSDRRRYTSRPTRERYVAIRAVDEQGNVGRPAVVDLRPRRTVDPADPVVRRTAVVVEPAAAAVHGARRVRKRDRRHRGRDKLTGTDGPTASTGAGATTTSAGAAATTASRARAAPTASTATTATTGSRARRPRQGPA